MPLYYVINKITVNNNLDKYLSHQLISISEERATNPVSNYERHSGRGVSSGSADSKVFNVAIPTTPETHHGSNSAEAPTDRINEIMRQLDPLKINCDRPKHPAYAALATRISSFTDWPISLRQTPHELASAGFLYAGYGDNTHCFFCGGLLNWKQDDDPWVKHAKWFTKCVYVRQNKGDEFVALVQIKHKEQESNEAASAACNLGIPLPVYNAKSSSTIENGTNTVPNSSCTAADVLSLPSCQSVLEMGYSGDTVILAFQEAHRTKDSDEIRSEDLMDVILTNEEKQENQNESNQTFLSNSEIFPAKESPELSDHSKKATQKEIDDQSMELLSRQLDNTTFEECQNSKKNADIGFLDFCKNAKENMFLEKGVRPRLTIHLAYRGQEVSSKKIKLVLKMQQKQTSKTGFTQIGLQRK